MVQIKSILSVFAITLATVQAHPELSARQNLPDPAGAQNQGNGQGRQFIGGQCNGVADCASGCCATLPRAGGTIGVCSGVGAQTQAGKQGCGFEGGSGGPAAPDAGAGTGNGKGKGKDTAGGNAGGNNGGAFQITVKPSTLTPDPAGANNVGKANGSQFITGGCTSDADCASGCCALVNDGVRPAFGSCSGPGANTQNGKQGCGFPAGGLRLSPA
ncbi:hypothetical protein B0H63DRAFT_517063 [Podospora didyma]|uniref:Biotrophy-associated secreted protein 2 n=1 Tax=Podospora didyma TaxID=330526 RepID=A0AAE0P5R5_9PEZI|nr:hypothetical protein B0H63DRAFT_517063 [Podospora didyma]